MGETGAIGWKRVAGGLALGHVAAACSFTASALFFAGLVDPDARLTGAWRTLLKNPALAPFMAAAIAAFVAWDGGFRGPWSRPGLPGDPRSDAMIVASGAAAGLAHAGTVWRLCVRPRLICEEATS